MDPKSGLRIRFSGKGKEILEKIAQATNQTIDQVVVKSIGLYIWSLQQIAVGNKVGSVCEINNEKDSVNFLNLGEFDQKAVLELFNAGVKDLN